MNASTALALKLGIDAIITLWAQHANKPPGWKPTPQDWAELDAEVNAATPEARFVLAKLRAARFANPPVSAAGATTGIK
jgi:hypothetical protein